HVRLAELRISLLHHRDRQVQLGRDLASRRHLPARNRSLQHGQTNAHEKSHELTSPPWGEVGAKAPGGGYTSVVAASSRAANLRCAASRRVGMCSRGHLPWGSL